MRRLQTLLLAASLCTGLATVTSACDRSEPPAQTAAGGGTSATAVGSPATPGAEAPIAASADLQAAAARTATAQPVAATVGLAPAAPADGPRAPAAPETLCTLAGAAGATVDCKLALAGDGAGLPDVAGLQLTVGWDPAQLTFVGLASEICAPGGAGCQTMLSPPLKSVGTAGHTLVTSPADPGTAQGELTLMLYHPGKPDSLLAADLGALRFRLTATATDAAPIAVRALKVDATTPDARPLTGRVADGKLAIAARR